MNEQSCPDWVRSLEHGALLVYLELPHEERLKCANYIFGVHLDCIKAQLASWEKKTEQK
jgi:hypothetical protein